MRATAALLLVAIAAMTAAGGASAAKPKPSPLKTYLAAFQQVGPELLKGDSLSQTAVWMHDHTSTVLPMDAHAKTAAENAGVQLALAKVGVQAITAPVTLRGPHSSLRSGVQAELSGSLKLAKALAATSPNFEAVLNAELAIGKGHDLLASWRQEVVAQLRRAGIAVPFWLKQVGAG